MKDWTAIRERFLRDGVPARLGGLAANLARIKSFVTQGGTHEVVASLIDESKHLIEWTAADIEPKTAAELVALQVELAKWQRRLPRIAGDPLLRDQLAEKAGNWSRHILELSGLLSPIERAAGMLAGGGSLTETLQEEHRKEQQSGR
jgi:hypothetical protein